MPSEAKKRCNAEHIKKLDQIKIQPYAEEGKLIREAAAAAGQSLQAYVLDAIRQRIERDKAEQP